METMEQFKEKIAKKGREGMAEYYLSRPVSCHVSRLLAATPLTPNQITMGSFFTALIAAFFFASGSYVMRLLGVLFLYISHILDVCDGEVARYRGLSSQYGCWLDETTDVLKFYFTFAGITWGVYHTTGSAASLVWGALAIINVVLMNYLRQAIRSRLSETAQPEVTVGKNLFLGVTVTTVYLQLVFMTLNLGYVLLVCFGFFGNALWVMKFISGMKQGAASEKKHDWQEEHRDS